MGALRIDVLPEEEKLLLLLRVECPDSWHEGPDARIVRSCCVFEIVVAPLTGIVGPGVPVQGGCTAVPERGWRTRREDPVFLEVGDILRHDLGWETGPDHSLQLSPGVYDIGQGYEGEPVHASEVDPQDFVGVVVRCYPKLLQLKLIEVEVAAHSSATSRRGLEMDREEGICLAIKRQGGRMALTSTGL